MARRRKNPPSPEAWALAMFGLLGLCAAGLVAVYLLGALTGRQLLWLVMLLGVAALSVSLRYLAIPRRPGQQ